MAAHRMNKVALLTYRVSSLCSSGQKGNIFLLLFLFYCYTVKNVVANKNVCSVLVQS